MAWRAAVCAFVLLTKLARAGVDDCAFGNLSEADSAIESPDRWVDEHGDQLYRVAITRVGDRNVAEDLVQETFLAAWKGRETFDGRSALATWLVAILHRKVADYFRKTGREAKFDEYQEQEAEVIFSHRGHWNQRPRELASAPESAAEITEFWEVVAECADGLPSPLAQAFHLRDLEACSPVDVSEQLGITRKNLSVRLHRARVLLRRCLEGRWGKEGKKPK